MYDIRQFRPTLYTVIILGMTAFAFASDSPGTWVVAMALVFLNIWLVRNDQFRPLPRYLANLLTLLLLMIGVRDVVQHVGSGGAVLAIGRFLIFVQIIKLFEIRANRDYAQLLVLSLLLMVAGSISTASLLFGVMLLAYLFISLYCCLLFHLKVESDSAKATLADSQQEVSSATLRQDQRWLSRSMRKLTGLVAGVSITSAVVVFIFCPRGPGGMMAGFQFRGSQALVGISDTVQFQDVAKITQSDEKVAEVHVWRNDAPVNGTGTLLLRGSTFDVYSGDSADPAIGSWQWMRSFHSDQPRLASGHEMLSPGPVAGGDNILQTIHLQPTGTHTLFSLAGTYLFVPLAARNFKEYIFDRPDQTLHTVDALYLPIEYKVSSSGVLTGDPTAQAPHAARHIGEPYLLQKSNIDPKIGQFARRPEVSGTDNRGPLAARRGQATVSSLDEAIARNIEHYLQTQFTYTLDLSDARKIMRGQDPVVAFLYDLKRGHCEYFAGAMTLMCQSLGMQARLVVGFKCDEFNTFDGGYYQVRQSHAHAWVEVLVPDPADPDPTKGIWLTFDPTSGRDSGTRAASAWTKTRHFLDFLEYKWANSVVGYDGALSETFRESGMDRLVNAVNRTQFAAGDLHHFLDGAALMSLFSGILASVISCMVVAVFAITLYFLYDRWRLRRRAVRIGLDGLSSNDQLRLARQLGFYAELMRLLERRRIFRPRHQTPLEFSASLTYLPNEAYSTIHRLTRIFYRIRFGDRPLTPGQHRLLANTLTRLATSLRI